MTIDMALDFRATLRVFSKVHTLAELSKLIGEPSGGFSIDDGFSKGKRKRDHTFWSIDSSHIDPKSEFSVHLKEILNFYDSNKDGLSKLKGDGCTINVFCLFSSNNGQGGATLPAEIMLRLSQLNLDLVFDVYADCDE